MKKIKFKNILPAIGRCFVRKMIKAKKMLLSFCCWVMRNKYVLLVACFLLALLFLVHVDINKRTDGKGVQVDIPQEVMHHLADSYDWHFTTFGETHVTLHLPIIVKSCVDGEWHVFTSHDVPDGFYFDENHHGKVYERAADGTPVKPWDFSITKLVAQLIIVVVLLLSIFLSCARWYKKRDETSPAPRGFVGTIEMLVMYIHDDVIRPCVGEHQYKKYANYLLTMFFFIFTTNLVGLIPGAANVTGNINVTLFLAFCTMLAINVFANKIYWKEILWPDVPWWLKFPIPLMPAIEIFGIISKPFALMIRLFANMMAGHAVMLSFTCVIFFGTTLGLGAGMGLNLFSVIMLLFMYALEVLVAFVQAYVFTLLSSVFIGLAHVEHHGE